MIRFIYPYRMILLVLILSTILLGGLLTGCASSLDPRMSYQGRLTDATGVPLDGSYSFTFRLFPAATGGTAIYTETKAISVDNGLFDTSIGPTSLLAGVSPEVLAQPLWLDVTIEGETLTPRQRLLGAPYAFTLMPGAVISSTFNSTIPGTAVDAIVKIVNNETDTTSHPALQVVGNVGIELVDILGGQGTIASDLSQNGSDIYLRSNDYVNVYLDNDATGTGGRFYVYGSPTTNYCRVEGDSGNLYCTGTITAGALNAYGEMSTLYATQSTEVQVEDFGSGQLLQGQVSITIDPTFAAAVNLDEYYVFVTPLGDCNGLYVTNKTATGFEVHELGGGTANIAFDYRIVAKRLGYEDIRTESVPVKNDEEGEK